MKKPSVHELPRKHQQKLVTPTLRISDFGERDSAMGASHRQVLLLFKKGGSRAMQSPHDVHSNRASAAIGGTEHD